MTISQSDIEGTRIGLSQAGPIPNAVLYNNGRALWDAITPYIGGNQYYGSFYDTTDQPLLSTSAAQVIGINSVYSSSNISVVGGSKITFSAPGTYNLIFVARLTNMANSVENAAFWVRYNGVDYPNSSVEVTMQPRKNAVEPSMQLATVSIVGTSTAVGDYVQLFWAGTSTALSLQHDPAHTSPVAYPATPSMIVNVTPVANIQSGAPGPSGSGTPIGPAGGALTGSYPNPILAADSVSSSNIVNGTITGTDIASGTITSSNILDGTIGIADLGTSARAWGSYFWFLTWGGSGPYQQRTTTFSVPTQSTCIFTISSTAYAPSPGGPYTMYSSIDGVTGWHQYSAYFHNNSYDHRTYPTGHHQVNLGAGTYTYRLYMPSGQYTDANDYSIVKVVGFPY